jgi:putative transposase
VVEQVRANVRGGDMPQAGSPHAAVYLLAVAPRRNVRDPKGGVANINGEMQYLWRAVDHEGEVLESHVSTKRDKAEALKFITKALKRRGRPTAVVTDRLRSYSAAMRELDDADRQECDRKLNNRAENSRRPFRRLDQAVARFRRTTTLQKFSSVHAQVHNHFTQERHIGSREIYRDRRSAALAEGRSVMT